MRNKLSIILVLLVVSTTAWGYNISFSPDDLQVSKSLGYDLPILSGGLSTLGEVGAPSIPLASINLALPADSELSDVQITSAEFVELPGYYSILPQQNPQIVGVDESEVEFVAPDQKIYSSYEPYPGNLLVSFTSGNMGGFSVGTIDFAPVQYIPVSGKIRLYTSIDFEVNYQPSSPDKIKPKVRSISAEELWRDYIKGMVVNPEEVGYSGAELLDNTEGKDGDMVELLIIAKESSSSYFDDFVLWKKYKGYSTELVTKETILATYSGTDDMEKIRNCIKDYFENKGTVYVIIGGVSQYIPMRDAYDAGFDVIEGDHNIPTDLYYQDLDGTWNADGDSHWGEHPSDDIDFYADVFVGRVPAYLTSAIQPMLDKFLMYDGSSLASEPIPYDYQEELLFAAAYLDAQTECGLCKDRIDNDYVPSYFNITKLYERTGNLSYANFVSEILEGKDFINHIDHSDTGVLGLDGDYITSDQLKNLTNSPKIVGGFYSIGCYAANSDSMTNCAFNYVLAPNGGGVGFDGNTRYGWYSPGNPYLYSNAYDIKFGEAVFQDGYWNAGEALPQHKTSFTSQVGNVTMRYIYYELYLTGDPTIDLYPVNPTVMNVTHDSTIPHGGQHYTVTVSDSVKGAVEGARVCAYKEGEMQSWGFTDASGSITLGIHPATPGTMHLTVTEKSHQTFEADVTVTTEESAINLRYFEGKAIDKGIVLGWEVTSDEPYSGFNLYRREVTFTKGNLGEDVIAKSLNGFTKVNQTLITGDNPYRYVDATAQDGVKYEYKLEVVTSSEPTTLGSTTVDGGSGLPTTFSLSQSYPNPAVDTATVVYTIPESAGIVKVNLQVYDLTGRLVKTLVSSEQGAGEYRVSFDLAGDSGEELGSGVYIYSLDAGSYHASSKMVVVR